MGYSSAVLCRLGVVIVGEVYLSGTFLYPTNAPFSGRGRESGGIRTACRFFLRTLARQLG